MEICHDVRRTSLQPTSLILSGLGTRTWKLMYTTFRFQSLPELENMKAMKEPWSHTGRSGWYASTQLKATTSCLSCFYPTSRSDSSGLWNLSLHLLREAPRVPALVSLVMCCNQFSVAIRDLRTRTSRVHLTLRHDLWLHNHVEGKLFGISARHKHHMVPNSGENRSDESDH